MGTPYWMAPEVISKTPYGTEVQEPLVGEPGSAGCVCEQVTADSLLFPSGGHLVSWHHGGGDAGWRAAVFQRHAHHRHEEAERRGSADCEEHPQGQPHTCMSLQQRNRAGVVRTCFFIQ